MSDYRCRMCGQRAGETNMHIAQINDLNKRIAELEASNNRLAEELNAASAMLDEIAQREIAEQSRRDKL